VAERLKAPVLKTGVVVRSPWVRIPPPPPFDTTRADNRCSGDYGTATPATQRVRPGPVATLAALQAVEAELSTMGGAYAPEVADAIGLVPGAFPSTRLNDRSARTAPF
jgi:hypothetical protein